MWQWRDQYLVGLAEIFGSLTSVLVSYHRFKTKLGATGKDHLHAQACTELCGHILYCITSTLYMRLSLEREDIIPESLMWPLSLKIAIYNEILSWKLGSRSFYLCLFRVFSLHWLPSVYFRLSDILWYIQACIWFVYQSEPITHMSQYRSILYWLIDTMLIYPCISHCNHRPQRTKRKILKAVREKKTLFSKEW